MIKDFKPRLYQETILATCVNYNTLVVLPTGMGKTAIAFMLAVQRLKQYPNSKILVLANTKPLVEQHLQTFKKHLDADEDKMVLFTGNVAPEKREALWKEKQLIFSTPQGLENDVISNRINLKDVSLIVFDESHRAVGDYSYVWLAKQYNRTANYSRILGLTASPGSDFEKISEVCNNLYIEEIEVRTDSDPDVKPYIQDVKINWVKVELPESFKEIKKLLNDCYKSKLIEVKKNGYISSTQITGTKRELLALQAGLHAEIAKGDKSFEILKSVSLIAEAAKVQHALELIETQGIEPLHLYLLKIIEQSHTTKVKANKNLVKDLHFRSALIKTKKLIEQNIEHPKLYKLKELVEEEVFKNPKTKIIVFNQFRDSASRIVNELNTISGVDAKLFVGQAKKRGSGLTQKKQIEILNQFRESQFNTICMTSVGEEGLDIPAVDTVIFYEPIPSAIRTIQRKGRTGRTKEGAVTILMTKNTRDEAYRWTAHYKEKRMYRTLANIKSKLDSITNKRKNQTLSNYVDNKSKIKIFADHREKGSGVIKELIETGVELRLERLESADYLVSDRVGIEIKKTEDFVNSIIDGRLLEQIKALKHNFDRPVVIVEGEQDIYSVRNIHPNAIRGMLATIAVSYGIPVIHTKNFKETASLLNIIAKREQADGKNDFSPHTDKKPMTLSEQQEYLVSALPNIGLNLAKDILREFKTIKNIANADEDQLQKVNKLGKKKAAGVKDLFTKEYS